MATHRISFADKNLIEQVAPVSIISKRVPRIAQIADAVADVRAMSHDVTVKGKFTRAAGFTPIGQRVAYIPSSIVAAILTVFPDAMTDRKIFYALLAGPLKDYDLRPREKV